MLDCAYAEAVLAPNASPWCRGPESNRRHYDFQSYALPTELPRRMSLSNLANSSSSKIFSAVLYH